MRIGEVIPAYVHPTSGVTAVVMHLARQFVRRGHEVEIWQLSPWPDALSTAWHATIASAGITLVNASRASGFRASDRAPDVVHLHNVFSVENNRLARTLRVPYVITSHGGYAPAQLAYHRVRKAIFKHLFELPMIRRARAMVALTEVEREEIARFSGRAAVVIPNGVDLPPAALHRDAFRCELGLGRAPRAVFAGRVDLLHKRLDAVLRGLSSAPGWHVAVVGGDFRDGRRRLSQQAAAAGVADRLHLVEERRGTVYIEAISAGDVFVLLSRWEGMSIALLEALALGVPALVSREVEERLPVAGLGAGWVVDPDGLGAALRGVEALSSDQRSAMRSAALRLARHFDWSAAADAYLDLFSNLPAASRGRTMASRGIKS